MLRKITWLMTVIAFAVLLTVPPPQKVAANGTENGNVENITQQSTAKNSLENIGFFR